MDLKQLLVDSKTTWVEFPGLEGFEVELANLSRKELVNLRKRCTQNKFNRKTRGFEDSLEDLLLVDLKGQDPKAELEYNPDNAKSLVENSNEFDNWLNEVVFDLDNFRTASKRENTREAKDIS
jgi:hypothetical protein